MLLLLASLMTACRREPPIENPAPTFVPKVVNPATKDELRGHFLRLEYDWDNLDDGVPPLVVERFPDDYIQMDAGPERKRLFFLSLLPMVLLVNDDILETREMLTQHFARLDRGEILTAVEQEAILRIAASYKVERDPVHDVQARKLLLNRVDIIPASLVLAQAAGESGYGTSRFAQLGNNLFGEMVFDQSSEGITPLHRPDGEKHRARRFPTLLDSLRSYMNNLNTHPAYQELRLKRSELRAKGETIRGKILARELGAYSVRGEDYIKDIRTLIEVNRLSLLSEVSLRPLQPESPPSPPPRPIPTVGELVLPKAE